MQTTEGKRIGEPRKRKFMYLAALKEEKCSTSAGCSTRLANSCWNSAMPVNLGRSSKYREMQYIFSWKKRNKNNKKNKNKNKNKKEKKHTNASRC